MPTVLITGANRGLGLEFARQYAADGWRVIATCREPAKADELAKLAAAQSNVSVHALDVAQDGSVRALAAELSTVPIDLLLNNAGVSGPKGQSFGRTDYDGWVAALQINTLGPLRMCEAFVENVALSDKKLMVAVTSGMGSIGDSSGGYYVYRSTKAALNMVIHNVALDLRNRGIIGVVINPGWVKTDMGTENAPLSAAESIGAMRKIFDKLGPEDTGKFLNWRGGTYEW
jgi:NAD(P)-dependent dehydrogenase (short-subunit alcohol dehydrogenase family)